LPSRIVGYEDIRLVAQRRRLTGSATVCDRDPNRRLIARLHFTDEGDVEEGKLQASRQWHEKNWMPLMVRGEHEWFPSSSIDPSVGALGWIYSIDPTIVMVADGSEVQRACPFAMEHLRGGAAIEYEGGYLAVTHETIEANEGRVYLHRLVKFTKDFE